MNGGMLLHRRFETASAGQAAAGRRRLGARLERAGAEREGRVGLQAVRRHELRGSPRLVSQAGLWQPYPTLIMYLLTADSAATLPWLMLHGTQLASQGKADALSAWSGGSMLRGRQAVVPHAQVPHQRRGQAPQAQQSCQCNTKEGQTTHSAREEGRASGRVRLLYPNPSYG